MKTTEVALKGWVTSRHCSKKINVKKMSVKCYSRHTQLTFTCSKSTIETLEKGVEYVQS